MESAEQPLFAHWAVSTACLEELISFYEKALCFRESRRMAFRGGAEVHVFMVNDASPVEIELVFDSERADAPANAGTDSHIAFRVADYPAVRQLHEEMGCIVSYDSPRPGLHFIADPNGSWIEILPAK